MTRLIPKSRISPSIDTVQYQKRNSSDGRDTDLVYRCARAWDKLDEFRKDRIRCKKYMFGDQWGDQIEYCGRMIPEEEYIKMQGGIPMTNNLIRRLARTVIGVYRNQNKTPVCVARDRDEQRLGETMSTMLEYNNKINDIKELNARMFEEFLISGLAVQKESYAQRESRRECWTDNVNPNLFFVDGAMNDPRHTDIDIIGEIHDVSFGQLASSFAKSDKDYDKLQSIYKNARDKDYISMFNDTFKNKNYDLTGFMAPQDPALCRVIEVWTLERRKALWCHDWLKGDAYIDSYTNKRTIDLENAGRQEDNRMKDETGNYILDETGMPALFMPEDEVPLIDYEYMIESYWYYRFLSPFGDILDEGESPYRHGSHPYTMKAYPFVDGEIHSFVNDVIDQQRYINHYIILNDFVTKASAKGVLIVDEASIPDDLSIEDIADEWTKFNGVIKLKLKQGAVIPQQMMNRSMPAGLGDMIKLQMALMEDVSGVQGALQGKQATSGTSGILYQQQANNASNSIIDLLESFSSFIISGMYKKSKNIQQFYDDRKIVKIVGRKGYVQWDPETMGGVDFDISISESFDTPVYRALSNELLLQLLNSKQISLEQMLEVGNFPFADQLLQLIQARQEELRAQQEQLAQGAQPAPNQEFNMGAAPQ